jgi:hypothetical protein
MNKYGNYTQNNHCTCGKLINNVSKYCTICHLKIVNKRKHSKNCQCCACKAHRGEYKGKNHPLFGSPNNGKKNGRYIDGRTLKKYYCDLGRLDSYYKSGYKTLIIWEHELKDIDKLIKKLLKFVGGV